MFEAYLDAMRNYAVFSGRASRRDYWFFVLTLALFAFAAAILDSLLGTTNPHGGLFLGLVFVAHLMPQLTALVRRLHDIGWSGWWLLTLLTGVGGLFLFALACLPGAKGPNRYGAGVVTSPHPTPDAVSSAPPGPGSSIGKSAAQKWLLIGCGFAILGAVVGGAVMGGTRVGCDTPEVKNLILGKVGELLNMVNNGIGDQPGMPQETLDLLASGGNTLDLVQGKKQHLQPSPDGKPYLTAISTTWSVGNRHACTAHAVDSKGRLWPVSYVLDVADDGKNFSVGIQQF